MRDVSAIIVTYNSESVIGFCLDGLAGCGQVIVVDNASADETVLAARREGVDVLANSSNRGFAAAVNQGVRAATGRYLLILNPDVILDTGLETLSEACERSGIASGCLTNADGTPQAGFNVRTLPTPASLIFECLGLNRIWPRNPVNVRYRCLNLDLSKPARVEQPAGALLMVRRDVFESLGGFDERFWPLWYEDVDFCRRAVHAGIVPEYTPHTRARHSGAHSLQTIEPRSKRLYWYGSLLRYVDKHYRPAILRVVCGAIILGSLLRAPSGMMSRQRGNRTGEYRGVLRMAAASFVAGRIVCPADGSGEDARTPSHGTQIRQVVDEN